MTVPEGRTTPPPCALCFLGRALTNPHRHSRWYTIRESYFNKMSGKKVSYVRGIGYGQYAWTVRMAYCGGALSDLVSPSELVVEARLLPVSSSEADVFGTITIVPSTVGVFSSTTRLVRTASLSCYVCLYSFLSPSSIVWSVRPEVIISSRFWPGTRNGVVFLGDQHFRVFRAVSHGTRRHSSVVCWCEPHKRGLGSV
jgi:hypothetical protein